MKQLNEYNSSYPTAINNNQAQEYPGVMSPIDAETVQGNERLNPQNPEGLHRINAFINHFFRKTTLNPQNEVAQLKSRLNHINLDFKFDNTKPLDPVSNFKVTKGEVFGVTPTTDLSVGFDRGDDLPAYNLEIRTIKTDDGFKLEGKLMPIDDVQEGMIHKKMKRTKRIKLIKELFERARSKRTVDVSNAKERAAERERKIKMNRRP
jgi:hypothetical protein